jgi:uncharacterized protein YbjT (DUF2867 family)
VIIFGATGMVGQGVLRECLLSSAVTAVLAVGRSGTGRSHAKLREILTSDLADLGPIEADLAGYDACFFCLGVSAAGMSEAAYRRITYDYTLATARTLARLSPGSTFVYVSGGGTNAQGRAMWARVKGQVENDVLALDLDAYMFRPGLIQPRHGITSKTKIYRIVYAVGAPLFPVLRLIAPKLITTTELVGRAMLKVAANGSAKRILTNADISALAASG